MLNYEICSLPIYGPLKDCLITVPPDCVAVKFCCRCMTSILSIFYFHFRFTTFNFASFPVFVLHGTILTVNCFILIVLFASKTFRLHFFKEVALDERPQDCLIFKV